MRPSAQSPASRANRTFYPAAQFVRPQPGYSHDIHVDRQLSASPANVSSPRLTFQSPGRAVNFHGNSPMDGRTVPHPVFQKPYNGSNLQGIDTFEGYGGKHIYPEMQTNPGFISPPSHMVGYGRNPDSPKSSVSNLFDRMYQSSVSGSSNELSSHSVGSKFNSSFDDHRINLHTTTDQSVSQLRNCSSQSDLGEFNATTKVGMMSGKASEASETQSLGKPGSIRPIYAYDSIPINSSDSGIYSNQPSLNRDNTKPFVQDTFRTATSKPEKMAFLRSPLPAAHARIAHEEHKYDSRRDKEYSESEEPLPFNSRPGLTERKRSCDVVEPALRDLQLTVFMRDTPPNKSFDMGESRYINKPYQRLPNDSRTGSMPYRVKKPTPLTLSNPALESERVVATEGALGSPPLITPLNSGEISSSLFTPNRSKNGMAGSPAMVRSGEDPNRAPAYTGPRLVPVDRIQESTGSESQSRAGSTSQDLVTAERLAKRLFDQDGFRKSDVVKHLGKRTEFSQLVRESYLRSFDFTSMTLDVALRDFLSHLVLSGETQERERVLAQFSHRFCECNPHTFSSQDSCHVLVCGIMILNTDLHRENSRKRMTINEFIENLSGQNAGTDFPKDLLKNIYHSIKNEPIEFQVDAEELIPESSKDEKSTQLLANPFLDIPDPSKAREFKTGYLMRKCCLEPDGRRTPMGKRGWKMFRVSLRELILYLHKDEHGFNCGTTFDDTSNAIRIHHSLAIDASDYGKRHDVFRLRTSDWSEYLFQASDSQECQSWIDTINGVASAFSAPPLPGAVGSQVKFQRPLMPSSSTKLSLGDQLAQHEQTLSKVEKDLAEHREFVPEKGSRPRLIQDYLDKETYLEFEQRRFRTYCNAIQLMLQSNVDLTKTETAESYFEKLKKSQGSGRFPKKAFTKEGTSGSTTTAKDSEVDYTEGVKKTRLQGANANLYPGLHPAKSVPALLYESRV